MSYWKLKAELRWWTNGFKAHTISAADSLHQNWIFPFEYRTILAQTGYAHKALHFSALLL